MKMTKYMRFLIALGAGVILAACAREPSELATAGKDGAPEEVTFSVGMRSALTKTDSTPFDDASGTWSLYVAAFNKADGKLYTTSMVGGTGYEPVGTLSDGAASIRIRLPRRQEFRVVFFAQKEGAYDVVFADGPQAAFSFKSGLKANDPALDAFYAVLDVTASKASYDVTLKRPFAQLNVLALTASVPAGQTTFRSSLSVQAPTRFDLYNGTAGATLSAIDFAENAIAAEAFGKYADAAKPYTWIGTAYVLVPASGQVQVLSFREVGMDQAIAPGAVPVKVNGRTNLVGNLYGSGLDLAFSVLIDGGFDEDAAPNPILERPGIGCFLSGAERAYVAGTDQFVREYDGNALTFVLLDPETEEQLAISGYSDTMQANDAVTMTVRWTKGSTTLLERSSLMYVLKDEGGQVWIADKEGNGFVIKK